MNILAFAGSNSTTSINKQLVTYAVQQLAATHKVEVLDLNDYEMPLYSIDKEKRAGVPERALDFAQKIDKADFLFISFAEHNGAYSVAFKNVFDWLSRIQGRNGVWGGKKMILMATSTGQRGGATVLELAKNRFPFSGGIVVGTFSLPSFHQHFDAQHGITDDNFKKQFSELLQLVQ